MRESPTRNGSFPTLKNFIQTSETIFHRSRTQPPKLTAQQPAGTDRSLRPLVGQQQHEQQGACCFGCVHISKEDLNRFNSDAFQSTERPLKCKLIYYAVMIHHIIIITLRRQMQASTASVSEK